MPNALDSYCCGIWLPLFICQHYCCQMIVFMFNVMKSTHVICNGFIFMLQRETFIMYDTLLANLHISFRSIFCSGPPNTCFPQGQSSNEREQNIFIMKGMICLRTEKLKRTEKETDGQPDLRISLSSMLPFSIDYCLSIIMAEEIAISPHICSLLDSLISAVNSTGISFNYNSRRFFR